MNCSREENQSLPSWGRLTWKKYTMEVALWPCFSQKISGALRVIDADGDVTSLGSKGNTSIRKWWLGWVELWRWLKCGARVMFQVDKRAYSKSDRQKEKTGVAATQKLKGALI